MAKSLGQLADELQNAAEARRTFDAVAAVLDTHQNDGLHGVPGTDTAMERRIRRDLRKLAEAAQKLSMFYARQADDAANAIAEVRRQKA